jgi:hypothetical protein
MIELGAPHEMIFELVHARAGEEDAGIVGRNQRIGGDVFVPARHEEGDPAAADFIGRQELWHVALPKNRTVRRYGAPRDNKAKLRRIF